MVKDKGIITNAETEKFRAEGVFGNTYFRKHMFGTYFIIRKTMLPKNKKKRMPRFQFLACHPLVI